MIIYKTINKINNKIYVGQDSNNNPNYLGSGEILKKAIKKNGKENFEKIILEKCASKDELNEREIFWIKELDAMNPKIGYNLTNGGSGGSIYNMTKEVQKKWKKKNKIVIKELNKRRLLGNFTKAELEGHKKAGIKSGKTRKERIKNFGYTNKEKMSFKKNGKKYTERIKKYGFTYKELKGHEKTIIKISGSKHYAWGGFIYIFTKNNELIYKFNSIKDITKVLKINYPTIKQLLKEDYLDLKKYPRVKNKLSNFDGCKFIQLKTNKLN